MKRATQMMHAATDVPDRYPLGAAAFGALLIVGGLWKLQGPPMYIAVGLGVVCVPGLKKSVIGFVAALAPYVPFLKKPNGEGK